MNHGKTEEESMKKLLRKNKASLILFAVTLMCSYSTMAQNEASDLLELETPSDSLLINSFELLPDSSLRVPVTQSGLFDQMEFAIIPPGTFMMGSSPSDPGVQQDEMPRHSVAINSFEIMTTEVTQGLWEEVMGTDLPYLRDQMGLGMQDLDEGNLLPIYFVLWSDTQDFIERINSLDSIYTYRLPSEAEWEYACRAGTRTVFYWGDETDQELVKQYCWYLLNSESNVWTLPHAENEGIQPVGTTNPNAWGLYDMSGNVWEWCQDIRHENYSGAPSDGSAWEDSGSGRIARGGSWKTYISACRSANRGHDFVGYRYGYIGFRLVRIAREENHE